MWPTFFILVSLAAVVVIHVAWQRRFQKLHLRYMEVQRQLLQSKQDFERTLAESSAQQNAVFDSMTEGVLILDSNGRIQLANKAAVDLLGLNGDFRDRLLLEALRYHELDELTRGLPWEGTSTEMELRIVSPRTKTVHVTASPICTAQQERNGTTLVFRDLTRVKQLERIRTEFVANVSHELRTPLSIIKGYVETLLNHSDERPEVITRFLKTIAKHSDRLTFLIEDLLTLSQLESGGLALDLQPIPVRSLVDNVIDGLRTNAEEKHIELVNQIPESLVVECDAARIEQVLFNLVENSVKYGRSTGHVWIAGNSSESGDEVVISVRDDGPGIPREAQPRVFERFYRVDPARSRETGGTGLGLSIVKHIIQLHRGRVWLESEPGKGSVFYIALPIR